MLAGGCAPCDGAGLTAAAVTRNIIGHMQQALMSLLNALCLLRIQCYVLLTLFRARNVLFVSSEALGAWRSLLGSLSAGDLFAAGKGLREAI